MKAEELYKLIKEDENFKKLFFKLKENKSITNDDATKEFVEYFSKKNINATKEDIINLFKTKMFNPSEKELSFEELSSISGGGGGEYQSLQKKCDNVEVLCHNGSNSGYHPKPSCSATVEIHSWCWSDDQCYIFDVRYDWIHN